MATKEKAAAIWQAMLADDDLFGDHRRNDDAVNLCCVCKVLDKDPISGFYEQQSYHYDHDINRAKAKVDLDFMNGRAHINRVLLYCDGWFDAVSDDIIENYGILSASYMQVKE